jgi:ATP-dependent RNA helicase DeaD
MLTFKETGLPLEILNAIEDLGYEKPTPIQEKAIPAILASNQDLILLAQTGTGKTAAFGLPLVHQTNTESRDVQSLVLCPTRELCMQITRDLESFAKYYRDLDVVAVYGGAPIVNQMRALKKGCQIVVGTPGRILDLIRRKALDLSHVRVLVLDEADEMLNMGFQEDLDLILSETPADKQNLLFSATMPPEIARITKKYMNKPGEITVGDRNSGAANVRHEYYMVHAKDRYEALRRFVDLNPAIYGIVFCRTRQDTRDIARKMIQDGYNADALNGEMSQAARDQVMDKFRTKQIRILVATDVAARGLDVDDLTHVVNFELPTDLEVYIHRSGRTGRAGKNGISVSIIHTRESHKIRSLEKMSGKQFERKPVPTGPEICERRLFNFVDTVEHSTVDKSQIESMLPTIHKKLDWLTKEELIERFVSVELQQLMTAYKNAADLNIPERSKNERTKKESQGRLTFKAFELNIGFKHNLSASRLIGIINELMPRKRVRIGKIDIKKKFSIFEIEDEFAQEMEAAFKGYDFEGTQVILQTPRFNVYKPDRPANFPKKKFYKFPGSKR